MADCTGVIAQLFIYPVKSCAGIELSVSDVTACGLKWDREWMIVDQTGQFLTQRQIPHMVWIVPLLTDTALILSAPNCPTIEVPFATAGVARPVSIWNDTVLGDDMGDEIAAWLDAFLAVPGKQFRLVRFSAQSRRLSSTQWTQGVEAPNQFSDGFAVNIVTQSALDALNERLGDAGGEPVSIHRFRPNIVIEGLEPHEEDNLDTLTIHTVTGAVEFVLVKPCPRCAIPNIDPYTASSSPEVGLTLAEYRSLARMDGAICFAMNAIVRSGAGRTLHTGSPFDADFAI